MQEQEIEFLSEIQTQKVLELLASQKSPQEIQKDIINIYGNGKRHNYSLVTSYIMEKIAPHKDFDQTLSIVCDKLTILIELLDDDKCKTSLQKLYDHINLELIRLNYTKELENDLVESKRQLDEIQTQSQTIKDDLKKQQAQYITILGIFASIVITFTAGFGFSSAVFSKVGDTNPFILAFIMCFVAFFIGNILHFLFRFIKDINQIQRPGFWKQGIVWFNVVIVAFLIALFVYTKSFYPFS